MALNTTIGILKLINTKDKSAYILGNPEKYNPKEKLDSTTKHKNWNEQSQFGDLENLIHAIFKTQSNITLNSQMEGGKLRETKILNYIESNSFVLYKINHHSLLQ